MREVDDHLTEEVILHCIGGFVLVVLYGLPRATDDLDVIAAMPHGAQAAIVEIAGPTSKLAQRYKVSIHGTGIVDLPEGYIDRLTIIPFPYHRLHLAVPDVYDLVLSKLGRNSPKDRDDVQFLASKCDLKIRDPDGTLRRRNATLDRQRRATSHNS